MSSSLSFVQYVCDQIQNIGNVRYRKMFGDYMVYLNDKPIFLLCDNVVYVKKLDELKNLIHPDSVGIPYQGAKEHYILDIENTQLCCTVATILEKIIPLPKKRKNVSH